MEGQCEDDDNINNDFPFASPHPLLIPHIIENIFSFLFGSKVNRYVLDVRTCRNVCKQWNFTATKLYRKYSEELVFGENSYTNDSQRMEKFISDSKNSKQFPVIFYRFDPSFFVRANESLFKTFLHQNHQWISTLKLWFDNQSNVKFPKRCYPSLRLESLEYLFFGCVVNHRGSSYSERMELTYILECLLVAGSSSLKKFCFSFPPKDIPSQQGLIKRFGDIVTQKCPSSVKNLKLEMKMTDLQLESLFRVGLSLDTLHCDFRGSNLSCKMLNNLLSQQRKTLQEIRLLDSEIKYCYELKFPRFEKLTIFEIQGGTIKPPLSFKDQFPVLEKLFLFGWENKQTQSSMLESCTTCESLISLELPYKIQNPNIISLAAKCFPNLKKLEITPTSESMSVLTKIFEMLTQLEELEITFPFIIDVELNIDPIFTGIDLQDCEAILKSGENLQTFNISTVQKHYSIANLNRLKKLTILDHSSEIRLTDITAYSLIGLQSLQTLEMGRFNISESVFKMLQEKVYLSENFDSSSSEESELFSDSSDSTNANEEDWNSGASDSS